MNTNLVTVCSQRKSGAEELRFPRRCSPRSNSGTNQPRNQGARWLAAGSVLDLYEREADVRQRRDQCLGVLAEARP